MSVSQLSVLALRGVLAGACKAVGFEVGSVAVNGVAGFLDARLNDPSQKAVRALQQSTERAWRAIEISLAGESLTSRLDRAEDRAFREQVRLFLDALTAEYPNQGTDFRRLALADLRAARKAGVLRAGLPGAQESQAAANFARFADPSEALKAEWEVLDRLAEQVRQAGYEHLARLVRLRGGDGKSLLAVAVRFFFRAEVTAEPQLFQGVMVERIDALDQRLDDAFGQLDALMRQHGERMESLLESVQTVVVETHGAVLDLHAELQRQGGESRAQFDALYRAVLALQSRLDLGGRELRPGDSLSIRHDSERHAVKQLVTQYRDLPADRRRSRPALLNAIGKLEVAAGNFSDAQQDFAVVADMVGDDPARGEAHFNAYLAALEASQFDRALAELLEAARCDPARYSPFSLQKYEPVRILGAGGFGVTFHCRYIPTGGDVAIKVLRPDGLESDVRTVFKEADALDSVHHPAIIRLRECDFADAARSRPYLVMEYFDGQTLEALVREGGPLDGEQFLPVLQVMAEGLRAAHARGVLHRDIKPANVLVRPGRSSDERWQVKIIDFGLALKHDLLADASTSAGHGKTVMGLSIAGTIDYAAPEQMGKRVGAKVGPPADVYGFGRTCCYALFGTPNPLRTHWRQVPEGVADLLESCLHEDPGHRLQGFEEVVQGLVQARVQEIQYAEVVEEDEDEEEEDDESYLYYLALGLELSSRAQASKDPRGSCEILICTAQMLIETVWMPDDAEEYLSDVLEEAYAREDYAAQARALRKGFERLLDGRRPDDLLDLPRRSARPLRIIQSYLGFAIEVGAPAYDSGDERGCYELYSALARAILVWFPDERDACATLDTALRKSARQQGASTQAWTMRHAFDEVLEYD